MCIEHNSRAAECSWHQSLILHSCNKQNQQGKVCPLLPPSSLSFLGSFSPSLVYDRCITSAFEAHVCDVEESRCVCFISGEHFSCVINNHVICFSLESCFNNLTAAPSCVFEKELFISHFQKANYKNNCEI